MLKKSLNDILLSAKTKANMLTAVILPEDEVSLLGAIEGYEENVMQPILIGNKNTILKLADALKKDISKLEIIDVDTEEKALKTAVDLIHDNKVATIMKGKIHTDHLLGYLLKRDNNLRVEGAQVSHVFALEVPTYHKLIYITDAVVNIYPNAEQKAKILLNAIDLFNKLNNNEKPNIGIVSAVETVNPKIQSTLDAEELIKNDALLQKSNIEGPFGFDNLISKEAAQIKGMDSKISGNIDIIAVPNLESGNILFKALTYLGKAKVAGVVLGLKVPVILTSRSDDADTRLFSSALTSCIS